MLQLSDFTRARADARTATRADEWYSLLGGLGGAADRGRPSLTGYRNGCFVLDDRTLSDAYRNIWLVRRIVEARADEALRRGWGLPEGTDTPLFDELNTATHTEGAFQRACHMADLKGGAGLYIGYKETGGPESLLEPAREGAEVSFLEVFDRFQLTGEDRVRDVDSPEYDRPQVWHVTGSRRAGLRFHESRMIRFPGAPRGDNFATSTIDRDWDDSVLQSVWADVQRYGVFWQTVAALLQQNSIGVLSISGLVQLLSSKSQDFAEARVDLLNQTLSNNKLMLLDSSKNEDYKRVVGSMADVPQLMDRLEVATAAAVGRPVAVLFGRAPAGLNATGESDMRLWYDGVECYRTRVIEPRLEKVLSICERKPIDVEFEPLWSPTEKEQAEVRVINAQADDKYWVNGVWSPEELRKALNAGKRPEQMGFVDAAPEPPEPDPAPTPLPDDAPAPEPPARQDGMTRDGLIALLEQFAG